MALKASGDVCHKVKEATRLPPDLILFEVLLRLRPKTLTKFRCVCTSWFAFISRFFKRSSAIFVCSHPDHLDNPDSCTTRFSSLDWDGNLINQFETELPTIRHPYLLFTCLDFVCLWDENAENIFLCKPSTQDVIMLPNTIERHGKYTSFAGLGYAYSTKEFKVIRVFGEEDCCEVFTLGSSTESKGQSWRTVASPPFSVSHIHDESALVNGAIYVLCTDDGYNTNEIAFFDFDREDWGQLEPPDIYYRSDSFLVRRTLREIRGYLCFVLAVDRDINLMDLWLLKDSNNNGNIGSWVKEYSIDLSPLHVLLAGGQFIFSIFPFTVRDDGSILLTLYSVDEYTGLLSYKVFRVLKCSGEMVEVWTYQA